MANLGGFAGGLAQGYQSGERMKMAQQELDDNKGFRERQMKIMEADEAEKQAERDRKKQLFTDLQANNDQWLGPKKVEDGVEQITNTDGTVTQQPKFKLVPHDFSDTSPEAVSARMNAKMGEVAAFAKYDPAKSLELRKELESHGLANAARDMFAASRGDADAAKKLYVAHGLDVKTASITQDPKTQEFIARDATGKAFNLTGAINAAAIVSAADAHTLTRQSQQDAQTAALNKSTVGLHDKQGGYYEAEAAAMPAKTESYRASGNLANARAGLAGEQGNLLKAKTESINNGTDPATSSAIFKASGNLAGAGLDGKPDVVTRAKIHQIGVSIIQNKPEKTKMSPEMAATMGSEALRKIKTDITKSIDAEPKDAFKQRGFKTRDAYIQDAVDRTISKQFPTLQMTNLPSVGAIDTTGE